jgi:hypothetical protein
VICFRDPKTLCVYGFLPRTSLKREQSMAADLLSQHSEWIGSFLIAILVPLVLGGATMGVFWLDARDKKHSRPTGI